MKLLLILLLGALAVGPLIVLYNLGVKHKRIRAQKKAEKARKAKEAAAVKQASDYKIKF